MALSAPTLLDATFATASVANIASAAITPASNTLLVVTARMQGDKTASIALSTTLANVGAWTVKSVYSGGGNAGTDVMAWAVVTGSPGTGTVTVSWTTAVANRAIHVASYTGYDPTTPVTQSKLGTPATTPTTHSVVLDATPAGGSCVHASLVANDGAVTAGLTELAQSAPGNRNLETQYALFGASATASWSNIIDGNDRVGIAAEIAAQSLSGAATGAGISSGSADITLTATATATGVGTSSGTADATDTETAEATGTSQSNGSATATATLAVETTGTGNSAGTANPTAALFADAAGLGQSIGNANVTALLAVDATGAGSSSGSAAITSMIAAIGNGAGGSSGVGDATATLSASVTGVGTTAGAASVVLVVAAQAAGVSASSGSAGVTTIASASAVGTGTSSGQGNAAITGPTGALVDCVHVAVTAPSVDVDLQAPALTITTSAAPTATLIHSAIARIDSGSATVDVAIVSVAAAGNVEVTVSSARATVGSGSAEIQIAGTEAKTDVMNTAGTIDVEDGSALASVDVADC